MTTPTAFVRVQPSASTQCDTGTSSSEMVEVSAATLSRRKNAPPKSCPPGISANRRGSTVKISPGPLLLGSNPAMENPTGKMIRPASSAIDVSSATIHSADAAMPSRRLK